MIRMATNEQWDGLPHKKVSMSLDVFKEYELPRLVIYMNNNWLAVKWLHPKKSQLQWDKELLSNCILRLRII